MFLKDFFLKSILFQNISLILVFAHFFSFLRICVLRIFGMFSLTFAAPCAIISVYNIYVVRDLITDILRFLKDLAEGFGDLLYPISVYTILRSYIASEEVKRRWLFQTDREGKR